MYEVWQKSNETDRFCNTIDIGRPKSQSEYFFDEDGVIYRRRKNAEHQLLVPKTLATEVVALNHDPIFASHPWRKRTLEVLWLRYYWPGLRQDVEDYVSKCEECQRRKQRGEYTAPLGEVRQPPIPLKSHQWIFVDRTPLPREKTNTFWPSFVTLPLCRSNPYTRYECRNMCAGLCGQRHCKTRHRFYFGDRSGTVIRVSYNQGDL